MTTVATALTHRKVATTRATASLPRSSGVPLPHQDPATMEARRRNRAVIMAPPRRTVVSTHVSVLGVEG